MYSLQTRLRIGPVHISAGALLLAAWLNYLDRQALLFPALIACGLHEMGHILVLRLFHYHVKRIDVTVIGAEITVDAPLSYCQEAMAALGGPAVNLLLALLFCRRPGGALFAGLNLSLAWFNLLPLEMLDGGRALRCLLACLIGPQRTDRVTAWVNGLVLGLLLAAALFLARRRNLTLLITVGWMLMQCFRNRSGGTLFPPLN